MSPAHPPTRRVPRRKSNLPFKVTAFIAALPLIASLAACDSETPASPSPQADPPAPAVSAPAPDPRPPSHQRMADRLAAIAASTADGSLYFRDPRAHQLGMQLGQEELERRLALLPTDGDPFQRYLLHLGAGGAAVRLGRFQAGIDHMRLAIELTPPDQIDALNNARFRLGVAYLRMGEEANCCLAPTAETCILPILPGGRHSRIEGSRLASEQFLTVLQSADPESNLALTARWLLNIALMTLGEYPAGLPAEYLIPESAFGADPAFPRFTNVAVELGVDTLDLAGGAVADDFDNDGDIDVITTTMAFDGPMRFHRNNGDGTWSDAADDAGLIGMLGGLNLVHADYDNDGDLDLLVLRGAWLHENGRHPNSLLRNDGHGVFTDVTHDAGLADPAYPTQTAAFADFDRDGDLDLYIGNESSNTLTAPCQLFRNNGDGTFTDLADSAGVTNLRYTKAVAWADFDNDLWPDLYVSNYGDDNRLYRNNRDGTFTDLAPALGVTGPTRSFPVAVLDYDNDGDDDILALAFSASVHDVARHHLNLPADAEPSALYRNDGPAGFVNVAADAALDEPMLAMGMNIGDIDGDGWLDLYVGTGDPEYWSLMPNLMFRNTGDGRFQNITYAGGFGHLQKGHGVAIADLDADGDLDVYQQMGGWYPGDRANNTLYRNPGFGRAWIQIDAVGAHSPRTPIGARIHLRVSQQGRERSIHRTVSTGGSFGGNPLFQHIGLGDADSILYIEIRWPRTGDTQRIDSPTLNTRLRIVEP